MDESTDTCCVVFSNRTGASLIGVICCLVLLQNLTFAVMYQEASLFFSVNVAIYAIVSFFFLRHKLTMKPTSSLISCKGYFHSFTILIYFFGNIWNFVYWFVMPSHIHNACEEDPECINSYQKIGFTIWLTSSVFSAYFFNILREYKDKCLFKHDEAIIQEM